MLDIKEFDRKLTMPKTGKLLGLSAYQEEIINHLMNDCQTINYRTRMGNSTAVIYYLLLNLILNKDFHVCYIGGSEEIINKIKNDFEMYLRYNLKFIEDRNYLEENGKYTIGSTGSSVVFITSERVEEALKYGVKLKDLPSKCSKLICENYVFPSWAEKDLEKQLNSSVQYLLEN